MHHAPHDSGDSGAALPKSTASLNERWRAFQLKLADALKSLRSPEDIVRTATMLLAAYLDASQCWYAEVSTDGATFHTRGGWFQPDMPPIPASGRIVDFGPELVTTMSAGHDFIVDDLQADPRTAAYAHDYATLRIGALLVAPLFKEGRWVANLNVAAPGRRRWTEDDVLVVRDVAERTWSAVENALAQAALRKERDRSQHIFDTMTEGFVFVDADEALVYVNGAAARIAGAPLATLRARRFWDVFPDLAGSEVEALYRRVRAGGAMEATDYHRIVEGSAPAWMEIRVYPALDDGLAVFFDDITARKRTILATQQAEAYKTMLLDLGDRLRGVADDPAAMMRVATEELARILDVPRVGYVSMDEAVEYGVVCHNYNDVRRVPDLPARRERLDDYGLDLAADIRAGRVMKVSDLATDPRTAGPAAQAHAAIGARASIAAPIQVGGKTVAFV
ncbi:MAG: GAF domain-containing protein, partial [Oxalobacteraceae bacterium]